MMMHDKILDSLELSQTALLGEGGEAQVYALDEAHIMRLFWPGTSAESVTERTRLLQEIAVGAIHLPFETPIVIEQALSNDQIYTIEKRIPGTSLLTALTHADGDLRRSLIEQYMEVAWQLGEIEIKRPFFGEIGRNDAIQSTTWQAYLVERAKRSLAVSPLAQIDGAALAASVDELSEAAAFVHLDYFAGNVMVDEGQINAVIDFGYSSIMGDRRMNALVAAAHLVTPRITPTVTAEDQAIAFAWLRERELFDYYESGMGWLAAYWTFASDDVELYKWCCSILT